jgi:hypothetical protein
MLILMVYGFHFDKKKRERDWHWGGTLKRFGSAFLMGGINSHVFLLGLALAPAISSEFAFPSGLSLICTPNVSFPVNWKARIRPYENPLLLFEY